MTKDWGFAALVEYGGKRILFDTGNNAEIFAHNVEAKGINVDDQPLGAASCDPVSQSRAVPPSK